MTKTVKSFLGLLLFIAILWSAIAFMPDNTPAPEPVIMPPSIEKIGGGMGYEVNAYRVNVEGLDFLVVVNANKGGVAITRIK